MLYADVGDSVQRGFDEFATWVPRFVAFLAHAAIDPSDIRLFQIFYDDWHQELLDPQFESWDALLLAAVLAILRYREVPTRERFWAAAGISALAVVTKPGIALFANGYIFNGSFSGAQVHQRSNFVSADGFMTSWIGELRLMPSSG
mgnify:CR=1 FL=1